MLMHPQLMQYDLLRVAVDDGFVAGVAIESLALLVGEAVKQGAMGTSEAQRRLPGRERRSPACGGR